MTTKLLNFVPAVLGCLIVAQAGLNRRIAALNGLPTATLLNASVLWIAAAFLFALTLVSTTSGGSMGSTLRTLSQNFKPWYVLPGLFGLALVFVTPWCIARAGAALTFVVIISFQIAAALAWDYFVEGISPNTMRVAGIVIALTGAVLAVVSRKA